MIHKFLLIYCSLRKLQGDFLFQGLADRGKLCARKPSCCMKNQTEKNTYPLNICTLKMQNADVPLLSGNGPVSRHPARFFCVGKWGSQWWVRDGATGIQHFLTVT